MWCGCCACADVGCGCCVCAALISYMLLAWVHIHMWCTHACSCRGGGWGCIIVRGAETQRRHSRSVDQMIVYRHRLETTTDVVLSFKVIDIHIPYIRCACPCLARGHLMTPHKCAKTPMIGTGEACAALTICIQQHIRAAQTQHTHHTSAQAQHTHHTCDVAHSRKPDPVFVSRLRDAMPPSYFADPPSTLRCTPRTPGPRRCPRRVSRAEQSGC